MTERKFWCVDETLWGKTMENVKEYSLVSQQEETEAENPLAISG